MVCSRPEFRAVGEPAAGMMKANIQVRRFRVAHQVLPLSLRLLNSEISYSFRPMREITLILLGSVIGFVAPMTRATETNDVPISEWQSRLAAPESSILPSFRPGAPPQTLAAPKRALPQRPQVSGRIEVTATGARAAWGAHQVQFKPNVVDAEPVQLTTPDGTVLRSRILGLCYLDHRLGRERADRRAKVFGGPDHGRKPDSVSGCV